MQKPPYFFTQFRIFLISYFLLVPPSLALANEEYPHAIGLQIGQAWPAGEIGKNREGALVPGFFYEYMASDVFSLSANLYRSSHNDGALKLNSATVGIKANLVYFDKLSPYATLGAGLYGVKNQVGAARETASKTVFGLALGVGADLDLNDQWFIGLLFNIHNLFSGSVNLPVNGRTEISGRWSGFLLRGGFRF